MTRYTVRYTAKAIRAISSVLPQKIAAAVVEFIEGPLADNPHRVGKRWRPPLDRYHGARRGEYRVIYLINDDVIEIDLVDLAHRRTVYRRR
ncbi:MAG: type II toxin-antitoxin system RelE/ParE family toxin [Pseudolysinimonas sp.]